MAGLQTAYLVKVESHVRLLWKQPITFVAIICHTNILHAYLKSGNNNKKLLCLSGQWSLSHHLYLNINKVKQLK